MIESVTIVVAGAFIFRGCLAWPGSRDVLRPGGRLGHDANQESFFYINMFDHVSSSCWTNAQQLARFPDLKSRGHRAEETTFGTCKNGI